jgi:lipid-A-disaccharide synthase
MADHASRLARSGVLMVAGEPSGDRHGSDLARAIRDLLPETHIWGMGGEHMARAGVELRVDLSKVSVVGIVEVLSHLAAVLRARRTLLRGVDRLPPSAAVLIDFPDFNLWLARALKRRRIPIFYYISPQVWAWRRGRVKLMARLLDRVGVILPFEETLLRQAGIAAQYVGHPLREQITVSESEQEATAALGLPPGCAVLGLLPGSRPGEVRQLLPVMLDGVRLAREAAPEIQPVIALSPLVSRDWVEQTVSRCGVPARVVVGEAHRVLRASRAAIVASGTATLEAAMCGTPMVVVYRASWISYLVGRRLVKVRHIALVNILAGREIVPELLQGDLTPRSLKDHVILLWRDEVRRQSMRAELSLVAESLGAQRASQNAARMVVEMVQGAGCRAQGTGFKDQRPALDPQHRTPNRS